MQGPVSIPQVTQFTLARAEDINSISAALVAWLGTQTQQFTNQTTVVVVHNFGWYPIVQVMDTSNSIFVPQHIVHNSTNQFTISFVTSTSGTIIYR